MTNPTHDFWNTLDDPLSALTVLDGLPGAVVFVKDAESRYVFANATLAARLGLPGTAALLGRTAAELFPAPLGERYLAQDRATLAGADVTDLLELHLYPGGAAGWCLTRKRALRDRAGRVVGLSGLSRDVALNANAAPGLASALERIQSEYAGALDIRSLARTAGLSVSAFERACRRTFGLTPGQLLTRARLDAATRLLAETALPVARVAVEVGYFDHSAFTRAFRTAVGLTPSEYRRLRGRA